MAATVQSVIDRDLDLTTYNVTGSVEAAEIIGAIEGFYAGDPTRKVLWNMTDATFDALTTDDVKRIAEISERHSHRRKTGKTALVFSAEVGLGLGRMYEAFRDLHASPVRQESFRSLDEALRWLED
jgi:hypothetical protein